MSPLTRSVVTDLRYRIEFEADCSVALQEERCNYTGELLGYIAWANREDGGPNIRSHTEATASGVGPIEALDRLAAALGVELERDALKAAA